MIEQFTSPVAVNNSQEPWLVGEGVVVSGGVAIPSLDFDFITGGLPGTVTFTRASTATYFNPAGVLTSAAINEARFDYNPGTLAARGLLVEEQRTNVCLQSAALNTTPWSVVGGNSSISANTTIAPDGTTTGDSLIPDTTAGVAHLVNQPAIGGLNRAVQRVISVFVKLAGYQGIRIQDNAFSGNFTRGFFNLSTLTASTTQSGNGVASGATITNVGNGWYRCSYISTPNTVTGGGSDLTIAVVDTGFNDVFAGDGTSGVVLWGCQVEAGAFPTSYIPTTTTTLTRSADVASVNTLSPWFNATEGTLYVQAQDMSDAAHATSQPRAASLNDGTTSNTVDISRIPASAQGRARIEVGGANQFNSLTTAWPLATQAKVALAYKANDYAACLGGGTVVTNTASSLIPTVTALSIGDIRTTVSNHWVGWIQRVAYYPRRLSNAELQTLTT